eukprot:scaffold268159_cov32-Tisochrysis_lutea.AAC.3
MGCTAQAGIRPNRPPRPHHHHLAADLLHPATLALMLSASRCHNSHRSSTISSLTQRSSRSRRWPSRANSAVQSSLSFGSSRQQLNG